MKDNLHKVLRFYATTSFKKSFSAPRQRFFENSAGGIKHHPSKRYPLLTCLCPLWNQLLCFSLKLFSFFFCHLSPLYGHFMVSLHYSLQTLHERLNVNVLRPLMLRCQCASTELLVGSMLPLLTFSVLEFGCFRNA